MTVHAEKIRRQLEERARITQSFSVELIGRVAQFAEKSAGATHSAYCARSSSTLAFANGSSASNSTGVRAALLARCRKKCESFISLPLSKTRSSIFDAV